MHIMECLPNNGGACPTMCISLFILREKRLPNPNNQILTTNIIAK